MKWTPVCKYGLAYLILQIMVKRDVRFFPEEVGVKMTMRRVTQMEFSCAAAILTAPSSGNSLVQDQADNTSYETLFQNLKTKMIQ